MLSLAALLSYRPAMAADPASADQQRAAALSDQIQRDQARERDLQGRLGAAESRATGLSRDAAGRARAVRALDAQVGTERSQIGELARALYVRPDSTLVILAEDGLPGFLVHASDLESAGQRVRLTLRSLRADEARAKAARRQVEADLAAQRQVAHELSGQLASLQATDATQQQALSQLQALIARSGLGGSIAQGLAAQAQAAQRAVAAQALIQPGGPVSLGGAGLRCCFPTTGWAFGNCTWYVAQHWPVSWRGDAWQWLAAAAAQGHPTSATPVPGAIVVYGPGAGYSVYGHVAIVTGVQPGGFTVSEMNYAGFNLVDQRLSRFPDPAILGFISG